MERSAVCNLGAEIEENVPCLIGIVAVAMAIAVAHIQDGKVR